ncbi:YycH family regulatory protein [Massilibacterium senegalense]|uniref:YycH family regulatory protein n=1 Tax=Massilibacterium senegalense TaxID=1632858 RepID=UPI0007820CE9|nr:two-component system activity regulator YycH [Massilibacterium senegalense]
MKKYYEPVKTTILLLLVTISLILTWQFWSYQPNYGELEDAEYIHVSIDQKKDMSAIISPQMVLMNDGSNHYGYLRRDQVEPLYQSMQMWKYRDFKVMPEQSFEEIPSLSNYIEVIFSTKLSGAVFKDLFHLKKQDAALVNEAERLLYFVRNEGDEQQVYAWFILYDKKMIVQAKVDKVDPADFQKNYVEPLKKGIKFVRYQWGNQLGRPVYLPENGLKIEELFYMTNHISMEDFKNALFTDPQLVKYTIDDSGNEAYIDGKRAMRVTNNRMQLNFVNPISSNNKGEKELTSVIQSIDYVNDHSGWTDPYYLFSWTSSLYKDESEFRLIVNDLPVFYEDMYAFDLATIYVSDRSGEIYEYRRSLLNMALDEQPILKTDKTIASANEVMAYINSHPELDTAKIDMLLPGYTMDLFQNGTIVSFKPAWYIKYNGVFKPLHAMHELEGGEKVRGLE